MSLCQRYHKQTGTGICFNFKICVHVVMYANVFIFFASKTIPVGHVNTVENTYACIHLYL